ncbi:MAG: hypothetical protein V1837_05005 [Candidatus Woesearchaeota archaeon]
MRLWQDIKAKVQGKFWKRSKKGVSILEEAESMKPTEEEVKDNEPK